MLKGDYIMKKFLKWFLGITAACSVIGLLLAYFLKDNDTDDFDDMDDDFEEEDDFDLDNDLKPVENRQYFPLIKTEEVQAKEVEDPVVKSEEKTEE